MRIFGAEFRLGRWATFAAIWLGVAVLVALTFAVVRVVVRDSGQTGASPASASSTGTARRVAVPSAAPSATASSASSDRHNYLEREALAQLRAMAPDYPASAWPDERAYHALVVACDPLTTPQTLTTQERMPGVLALDTIVVARVTLCPEKFPTGEAPPS